jgi:hypothetical protein
MPSSDAAPADPLSGHPRYWQRVTILWRQYPLLASAPGEVLSMEAGQAVPVPVWDLDGVAWHDAIAPPPTHGHWAQTLELSGRSATTYRCPCGARGGPGRAWLAAEPGTSTRSRLRRAFGLERHR